MLFKLFFFTVLAIGCVCSNAAAQDLNRDAMRQFELQLDTDFQGGDIPAFLGKREFRGISIGQCAGYCLAIRDCAAFTYNTNARVCFPKQHVPGTKFFPGAVSGIRVGSNIGEPVETGFSPYLLKSSCRAVRKEIQSLGRRVKVDFTDSELKIQRPARIRFNAPKIPGNLPAFLMFSFDQPVRFKGKGFYVLAPDAKGPFGSKVDLKATRVVIPLFPDERDDTAEFSFVPLSLSTMGVTAAVVAQSGCGQEVREIARRDFSVPTVRSPKLFMFDQFGATVPVSSYGSPKGDRYIDVYESFFRIISSSTNAPVAEITGRFPRFSPSGRFVTVEFAEGVRIFDAIDGAALGAVGYSVAWDLADSFVIGDHAVWGLVEVRSPFIEPEGPDDYDPRTLKIGTACHGCQGIDTLALKIDLENNFLIAQDMDGIGDTSEYALSLTTPLGNEDQSAVPFIKENSGIVPVTLPTRWETRDPLRFSNIAALRGGSFISDLKDNHVHLAKNFLISTIDRKIRNTEKVSNRTNRVARLLARMNSQFGITTSSGEPFQEVENAQSNSNPANRDDGSNLTVPDEEILKKGSCTDIMDSSGELRGADSVHFWKLEHAEERLTLIGFGCNFGTTAYTGALGGFHTSKAPSEIRQIDFGVSFLEDYSAGGGCGGDCGFRAQLIDNRYILTWAKGNSAIAFYDIDDREVTAFQAYRGRLIEEVYVTSDHKHIIQVNSDGTFAVYAAFQDGMTSNATTMAISIGGEEAVADNIRLIGHYDDDELVVWVPEGYFDASYEASHQIFLKFDGSDALFSMDQFATVSLRPDLFKQALNEARRTERVSFQVPPIITTQYEKIQADRLQINIQQQGGKPGRHALIYQDGLLTDQVDLKVESQSWSLNIERKLDTRWISTVVIDDTGLTSSPLGHDLGPPKAKRDLIVLAVGIDEYSDPAMSGLNFSKTDAFMFSEAIQAYAKDRYRNVQVEGLADQEATRAEIVDRVARSVSQGGPDTDVILYFSGHGLTDSSGNLFLGLTATRVDDLLGSALPWTEIARAISKTAARTSVILDTCHSGTAGQSFFATNDDVADTLLRSSMGSITILSASKGRESSIEDSDEGGGVFTKALVDTLADDTGEFDLNQNGLIEVSEAYRSVKSRVSKKTDAAQTPWLASNRTVGERPLF